MNFKVKYHLITVLVFCAALLKAQHQIQVEFTNEGEKIELNSDFQIYFVLRNENEKVIIKPKIENNSFLLPDFYDFKKGHLIFKYDGKILGVGLGSLTFDQSMKWEIGFDKKPYADSYHLKEPNAKETKAVVYIAFHPLEKGDGTVTLISIKDPKVYKREVRALLN